jgi:hypothetical protein
MLFRFYVQPTKRSGLIVATQGSHEMGLGRGEWLVFAVGQVSVGAVCISSWRLFS